MSKKAATTGLRQNRNWQWLRVRAIRVPQTQTAQTPERASFAAELRDGLSFFAGNKFLVSQAISVVILMLGVGAVNALALFFVLHNLHTSAGWVGTISAVVGVGAVAGALTTAAIASRVGLARLLWLSMLGGGLALIGLSRCTALAPALAACFLLGASVGILNATEGPMMLKVVPAHLMGRVSAVFSPLQQISSIASMATAGLLASTVLARFHEVIAGITFGPYDTIFGVAGLLFAAAGLALIRPLRDFPETAPRGDDAGPAQQADAVEVSSPVALAGLDSHGPTVS